MMLVMADDSINVLLNIQLPRLVRDEFRIAAKLKGLSMSALLYQHILQTIRREKDISPQAFPDYVHEEKEVSARSGDRFKEYADAFDADDLSENEWQYLELHFRDKVNEWRRVRAAGQIVPMVPPPPLRMIELPISEIEDIENEVIPELPNKRPGKKAS